MFVIFFYGLDMEKIPCVYILTNKRNGTLYVGVTSDLSRRIWEHKEKTIDGFTKKYGLDKLVFFEDHGTMYDAISREKTLKRWRRQWKLKLIESINPEWKDLYTDLAWYVSLKANEFFLGPGCQLSLSSKKTEQGRVSSGMTSKGRVRVSIREPNAGIMVMLLMHQVLLEDAVGFMVAAALFWGWGAWLAGDPALMANIPVSNTAKKRLHVMKST
jgi:putative endonuclease